MVSLDGFSAYTTNDDDDDGNENNNNDNNNDNKKNKKKTHGDIYVNIREHMTDNYNCSKKDVCMA